MGATCSVAVCLKLSSDTQTSPPSIQAVSRDKMAAQEPRLSAARGHVYHPPSQYTFPTGDIRVRDGVQPGMFRAVYVGAGATPLYFVDGDVAVATAADTPIVCITSGGGGGAQAAAEAQVAVELPVRLPPPAAPPGRLPPAVTA